MIRSLLLAAVEGFDHEKPVLCVDAQQIQQHEADRASLGGGAVLHLAPQLSIDVAEGVLLHWRIGSTPHFSDHQALTRSSADGLQRAS